MSPFQTPTARLARSASLSEVTEHLEVEMPAERRFGFVPGQWLRFKQAEARKNIKNAAIAAKKKRTIAHPPKATRAALRKQASKVARRKAA